MNDEQLTAHLNALKTAAAEMLAFGTASFSSGRPDEYAALKAEFDAGQVELGVTVRLVPELIIECWGARADGVRQVFTTVQGRAAAARSLN